jgi:hypothetical protein
MGAEGSAVIMLQPTVEKRKSCGDFFRSFKER